MFFPFCECRRAAGTGVRRRWRSAAATLGLLALLSGPAWQAHAVVILDSTWRAEGGAKGRESQGFGAHLRLAAEPQFRAVLALSSDAESWGEASATWLGNDDKHAYLLTVAHIYEKKARPDEYSVRTPDGRVHTPDQLWMHPQWNGDFDTRTGFDLVVLRLPRPLAGLGPPPLLYGGAGEAGQVLSFVGFGSRGIGSTGEQQRFYSGAAKAAAQGIVSQVLALRQARGRNEDAGNYLGIYLPKEDGSLPNPHGASNTPATRLVGLLGSGDSGGSAWMQSRGQWVIVGVNSNGSGTAAYGDESWFTRVSAHRSWIRRIFPGARFSE